MARLIVLGIAGGVVAGCMPSAVYGAETPEQHCHRERYRAAAKYAACHQKAMGRHHGSGGVGDPSVAASWKCTVKYAANWSRLRAIGAGPCDGNRFETDVDGKTVTDKLTGLVWERKTGDGTVHDVNNSYTWSAGSADADGTVFSGLLQSLNGGACFTGQCDWRLPTIAELATIRLLSTSPVTCSGLPCIDPIFGTTMAAIYWSSTTDAVTPSDAWVVFFDSGHVSRAGKAYANYARAVRGGL